eukprot:scaffold662268_cov64-Prasinocladus_malaysianus.AAC.1
MYASFIIINGALLCFLLRLGTLFIDNLSLVIPKTVVGCLSQVSAKVVGIPPGTATDRKVRNLYCTAAGIGGVLLGLMAGFSAWFDASFYSAYGIMPCVTGALLITNLFVSVNRKVNGQMKICDKISEWDL